MRGLLGRARRIATIGVMTYAVMAGVFANAAHAAAPSIEADFVARINAVRAANGAGPLAVEDQLVSVARTWTDVMVAAGNISHNPNLSTDILGWRHLGENVGMGPSVDSLEAAFEASPHHFANMIDPTFTTIGVGVTVSGSTIFVTEDYKTAKTAATPAAVAPRVTPSTRSTATTAPHPVVTAAPRPKPVTTVTTATTAPPTTVTTAPPQTVPPRPAAVVWQTQPRLHASSSHSSSTGNAAMWFTLLAVGGVAGSRVLFERRLRKNKA